MSNTRVADLSTILKEHVKPRFTVLIQRIATELQAKLEHEVTIQNLEVKIEELNSKIKSLQTTKAPKTNTRQRSDSTTIPVGPTQAKVQEYEDTISSLKTALKQLEGRNTKLTSENKTLKESVDILQKTNIDLEESLSRSIRRNQEVVREEQPTVPDTASQDFAKCVQAYVELQTKYETLQREYQELYEQSAILKSIEEDYGDMISKVLNQTT